jgi:hypothetical protein
MARVRIGLIATLAAGLVAVSGVAVPIAVASPRPAATLTARSTCGDPTGQLHVACFDLVRRPAAGGSAPAGTAAGTPQGFGATDLQSAYNVSSAAASAGAGERVYIDVAYNDPQAAADLAVYRSQYGLPPCTVASGCFQQLNQSGDASPLPGLSPKNDGWGTEAALNLDMVSAICPNCGLTLMEADSDQDDGLLVAIKAATTLGATFVSVPWGGAETAGDPATADQYFDPTGVVYSVAAGDQGYAGGTTFPASSPYVVSVGGTSLKTASNARGWTETAWNNTVHTGPESGCSAQEAKPAWQSIIAATVCANRAQNDVSAVADPNTGVAVYDTSTGGSGGWATVGGTSASTPIIAGIYALAGVPASSAKPPSFPYADAAGLNDITSGASATCTESVLCQAGVGWDGPTGLGSPNGVAAFEGPRHATALSAGKSAVVALGKAVTLTTTLTDTQSAAAVAGSVVALFAKSGTSKTYVAVHRGSTTTSSSGHASVRVSPTKNTVYQWRFSGTSRLTASTSKTQTVDVTQTVTLVAKPTHLKSGKRVDLFGVVAGATKGETVTVEQQSGSSWKTVGKTKVAKLKLPNGKRGVGYVLTDKLNKKGKDTFRAVTASTKTNPAGTSKPLKVTVT